MARCDTYVVSWQQMIVGRHRCSLQVAKCQRSTTRCWTPPKQSAVGFTPRASFSAQANASERTKRAIFSRSGITFRPYRTAARLQDNVSPSRTITKKQKRGRNIEASQLNLHCSSAEGRHGRQRSGRRRLCQAWRRDYLNEIKIRRKANTTRRQGRDSASQTHALSKPSSFVAWVCLFGHSPNFFWNDRRN